MSTPADLARQNAISFECKKDALQQRQSGDWKISFTVQGVDMDERITRAAMGTRFVAVLVEVNDDETPVRQPATPAAEGKSGKRDWRDMQPAQQAGIRCAEPIFAAFLRENYAEDFRALENNPAETVRFLCGVNSRAQLNTKQASRVIWHQIDEEYQGWLAMEHA